MEKEICDTLVGLSEIKKDTYKQAQGVHCRVGS